MFPIVHLLPKEWATPGTIVFWFQNNSAVFPIIFLSFLVFCFIFAIKIMREPSAIRDQPARSNAVRNQNTVVLGLFLLVFNTVIFGNYIWVVALPTILYLCILKPMSKEIVGFLNTTFKIQ